MEGTRVITPPLATDTGNWAGYEWHGGTVAAAEFTVPQFPYHDMNAAERSNRSILAIWAGLTNGPDIAQIGIYDYVLGGHVDWATVCAFWPKSDQSCGPNEGVSTGDTIAVSVHRNGLTYTMAMRDYGPHNRWSVRIKGTTGSVDTTAAVMAESTGTEIDNLTHFAPFRAATSGDPAEMFYSATVGHAQKINDREIQIDPRR